MDVVYERCCGVDVHKKSIVACMMTPEGKEVRTFGTMTRDLLGFTEWITDNGCTHVAMESTGVYWKPIYNLLEASDLEVLVVNAKHIKAVPGRKTDVKDAEWIGDLLRHGLLQGSYIPDRDQRELRELIRYRKSLIQERSREINRMQKVLEGCNIKLGSVLSDINGVSGRLMLQNIINGVEDPEQLASLAQGKAKSKVTTLQQALTGIVGDHQRKMLARQLGHIEFLDQQISELDSEVEARLRPFDDVIDLLDTIPGVGRSTAETILAEVGTDMERFPSADHLASWAGMTPGHNESAGKRKSTRTRKGNKALRWALTEAARAAARTKDTYLSAQYRRLAGRRGSNRAAVAVGHTIIIIAYHIIKDKVPYHELGADYFDRRKQTNVVRTAVKRLETLGYKVTLEETA